MPIPVLGLELARYSPEKPNADWRAAMGEQYGLKDVPMLKNLAVTMQAIDIAQRHQTKLLGHFHHGVFKDMKQGQSLTVWIGQDIMRVERNIQLSISFFPPHKIKRWKEETLWKVTIHWGEKTFDSHYYIRSRTRKSATKRFTSSSFIKRRMALKPQATSIDLEKLKVKTI